jgi:ethanolamine utilization microcompartment shell protein EutS
MSDANDVVINTNANAVTLKKGTGDNTLLKLSNTSTSLGNGAFSVGLNTISIGCNADTADAVPFEQDMEITDGKLTINTIRQSDEGDYCLMYDPTSVPKELTYSRYIPDHLDQIDVSLNVHDVSLNVHDVSLNIHDVSLNGLDISVNIIDVSLNVHDVSLNGLDISVNIIDVSLNIHDVSLNGLDISVNIIDVSLNIHDVSLNVLDVSLNIIDVSLNDFMNSAGAGSTFAIGAGSSADGENSFAIGNNATTGIYNNAVAIGNGSTVGASNVISLGDGTQNVGIGTTTPSEVLEISGNVFVNSPDDLVGLSISAGQSSSSGSQSSYLELIRSDDNNDDRTNWKLLNDGSTSGNFHLQRRVGATGTYTSYMTVKEDNGRVGIGTTTPTEALDVNGNINFSSVGPKYIRGGSDILTLESEYALKIKSDWNDNNSALPADIIFYTGASERMRIKRDTGRVGIGATNPQKILHLHDPLSAGIRFTSSNSSYRYVQMNQRTDGLEFHMPHDSGNVNWRLAGIIQATSRNSAYVMNFTGQHRTFIENVLHTDASNNQGLIVCANKNTYMSMSNKLEKGNKAITQNESLPLVSLSTKSKDKSCFGVISDSEDPEQRSDKFGNFVTPYEKEDGDTRIYINSVGEGAIWVSNKNGSLESGDYITTSDIPGYGETQDDDILHNYTVAKITMDCDFNPQPQPKEIILKQETLDASGNTIYENVLDDNSMLQWTNELDGSGNIVYEYPYNLRYLDLSGNRYSKDDYDTKIANNEEVYIAAYVGCTYHCG